MSEIRNIPLDRFTSSIDGMAKLNESIVKALNVLEPDEDFAILGIKGVKGAELTVVTRLNDDWSFAGFLKHEPNTPIDWGVSMRFSKNLWGKK